MVYFGDPYTNNRIDSSNEFMAELDVRIKGLEATIEKLEQRIASLEMRNIKDGNYKDKPLNP